METYIRQVAEKFKNCISGQYLDFALAGVVIDTAMTKDDELLVSYANHMAYGTLCADW